MLQNFNSKKVGFGKDSKAHFNEETLLRALKLGISPPKLCRLTYILQTHKVELFPNTSRTLNETMHKLINLITNIARNENCRHRIGGESH